MSKVNREIVAETVRVVDSTGEIITLPFERALIYANEKDLDLVQMNTDTIPICKVFDYNKSLYQKAQDEKKNKKPKMQQKEIHLSLEIQENDMKVKSKQVKKFIDEGKAVLVTLKVLGRKNNGTDVCAKAKLEEFMNLCGSTATINQSGDIYSFLLKP